MEDMFLLGTCSKLCYYFAVVSAPLPPLQVYRRAQHTRFEHSVGVSHLAGQWANQLLSRGYEEGWGLWGKEYIDREWRQKVDMVSLAGGGKRNWILLVLAAKRFC